MARLYAALNVRRLSFGRTLRIGPGGADGKAAGGGDSGSRDPVLFASSILAEYLAALH
jgi:hypothetical protein